jgi:glycerophosphoryl diester phosphodiesterase
MKSNFLYVAVLLSLSCSVTRQQTTTAMKFVDNSIVAHRGAWKKNGLPENSIASLKEAIELGCTGSEFDVRMSADDTLVINHDPAHADMEIEKTTYTGLITKKLSNGELLPTLRNYITAGMQSNRTTRLVLEIKPSETSKERGQQIAQKVVQLVKQLHAEKYITYISFDYDILKKVVELDPAAITQYLNGNKTPDELKADKIAGADYHFTVFRKHPEWITSAKANKIILNAWTVNTAEDMDWLLKCGFDFITTNEPELLAQRVEMYKTSSKLQ